LAFVSSSSMSGVSSSASGEVLMPVRAGDVLAGKYLVERVLAVGGMGAVVAATHRDLGDRVALKFMLRALAASQVEVRRFMKEARAARAITSEHAVRVSDIGTLEGGEPYIVMEYLEGHDLAQEVARRGPLAVDVAIDYVMQTLQAIAEAHSKGIVHRDLKPSNLFLTRRADGTPLVKVLDFGIAKARAADPSTTLAGSDSSGSMPLGSPHYVSPEQIRNSKDVDARSDVWSMGVILYELLTGRPPFTADEVGGVLASVLTDRPKPMREQRPELPAELDRIVLACLAKDVERRTQSVAELGSALAAFGSAEARLSLARIVGISGSAAVPVSARRSPAVKLAAFGAGLAASAIVGVIVAQRSTHERRAPEPARSAATVAGRMETAPAVNVRPAPPALTPLPATPAASSVPAVVQREPEGKRGRVTPASRGAAPTRKRSLAPPPAAAGPEQRRQRAIDTLFEERK